MRYDESINTNRKEQNRIFEFLTVFGVSILFTFAGMHYMKTTLAEPASENKSELPYALEELPETPSVTVSISDAALKLVPFID